MFEEALRVAPDTGLGRWAATEAHLERAALRSGAGNYAGAAEDYRKAVAKPLRPPTSLEAMEPPQQTDLEAAAKHPASPDVAAALWVALGRIRVVLDPEQALEDYLTAIENAGGHRGMLAAAHAGAMFPALLKHGPAGPATHVRELRDMGVNQQGYKAAHHFRRGDSGD